MSIIWYTKGMIDFLDSPRILMSSFFERDTIDVAKGLIGKRLVFSCKDIRLTGIISETEAYTQEDPACHTFGGRVTPRTQPMFGCGGTIYIYLIYGRYHCFNVVTEPKGRGCAVLIRGVIPVEGEGEMRRRRGWLHQRVKGLVDGPGKLMQAFQIPVEWSGRTLFDPDVGLKVVDAGDIPQHIEMLNRVGISKGQDRLWRFRCEVFLRGRDD